MGWFEKEKAVALTCHKCQTRFSIRNRKSLRNGAKSTCRRCGTKFGICVVAPPSSPESPSLGNEPPTNIGIAGQGTSSNPQALHLFFRGNGGTLFGIHIVNLFLTVITMGIYTFWAKVKVRKYLWGQIEFSEDRLAYHGTGLELLKGLLRASVIFGIPYFAIAMGPELAGANAWFIIGGKILATSLFLLFIPIAIVGIRRYRLSRTSWRGIRFSFRGRAKRFLKIFFGGWALTILSLGAYYPFFSTRQQAFFVTNSFFGTERFRFSGKGGDLLKYFLFPYGCITLLVALSLIPMTSMILEQGASLSGNLPYAGIVMGAIGITYLVMYGSFYFWYAAQQQRYFWEHTYLGEARFHFPITTWSYFKLKLGNFLLLILTLGFAWPWTLVRNIQFVANHLSLRGPANLDMIVQDSKHATPTGEGLDSFLDTGFELG